MGGTRCVVLDGWYQMRGTRWVVSDGWYQMGGARWVVPDGWCQMGGVRWVVPDGWYQMGGVRWVVPDGWYQMGGVRWVAGVAALLSGKKVKSVTSRYQTQASVNQQSSHMSGNVARLSGNPGDAPGKQRLWQPGP